MDLSIAQSTAVMVQIAMGIGLAASTGLRAFLPLLAVGVAGRLDWLPLTRHFDWMESGPALIVFSVAVFTELLADKVPIIDHFLDAVQMFVKPIAGTVVMASVLTDLSPLQTTVLAVVGGASAAGAVHLGKTKLRLVSSMTTAGVANPFVSITEDVVAFFATVIALVVPFVLLILLVPLAYLIWRAVRRMRRDRPVATA